MKAVWDSLAPPSDLIPPKATSNTLCGDSCIAESEWYIRLATVSGSGSCGPKPNVYVQYLHLLYTFKGTASGTNRMFY